MEIPCGFACDVKKHETKKKSVKKWVFSIKHFSCFVAAVILTISPWRDKIKFFLNFFLFFRTMTNLWSAMVNPSCICRIRKKWIRLCLKHCWVFLLIGVITLYNHLQLCKLKMSRQVCSPSQRVFFCVAFTEKCLLHINSFSSVNSMEYNYKIKKVWQKHL